MIVSPICEMIGIEYPIFQGGMAWIADGKLAAAVSNGGGLGIISAMNAGGDYLREQIRIARELTDKPFGVNIMLMSPHVDEVAKIVAEEKVAVVTTGAGMPKKYMGMWKEANITVIPVVASVAAAKMMEKAGASAVIAEGGESGGHIGEMTTMPLVPQVCDAVNIPVLAAGGIGDGRGMAAAFMLGAVGVQMGTRFLLAEECGVHQNYKDMVLKATDISTVTTGRRFGGNTCRCLKNPFSREFLKVEYAPETTAEDVAELGVGALRKAAVEGDTKAGCFLAGQISGMVKKEQPAAEIVKEIATEAEELLNLAKEKELFITEAIWTRYMPLSQTINDLVNGGIIGRPMTLSANLGYPIGNRERLRQPALAGGALLDLGVYALNFASMVFGTDVERVTSTCVKTDTGVDAQNSITLTFKDGKIAVLHSSMLSMTDRQGIISGDKGHLIIENINNPQRIRVVTEDYKTAVVYNCPPQITGYEYQVYASMEALRNGWLESPYMPHAETLRIMRMMDDLRREWGVRYPADE